MSPVDGSGVPDADSKTLWSRYDQRILGGFVLVGLVVGTLAYSALEGWSYLDSFYFSTVALTVVGYGDVVPTSDLSKVFTVVYIFAGVAIVGAWLRIAMQRRIVKSAQKHSAEPTSRQPDGEPPTQRNPRQDQASGESV